MKALVKALNFFVLVSYDVIKTLAGLVMAATIFIVTAGIISRFFFSHALSWGEELCCLLLIWLCYMWWRTFYRPPFHRGCSVFCEQ